MVVEIPGWLVVLLASLWAVTSGAQTVVNLLEARNQRYRARLEEKQRETARRLAGDREIRHG